MAALVAGLLTSQTLYGDTIISYQNSILGNTELEAHVNGAFTPYIIPASFSIGGGLVYRGDGSTINEVAITGDEIMVGAPGADGTPQTIAEAIANNQYVELSFAVSGLQDGEVIKLTSFTYGVRRNRTSDNEERGSGARYYQPYASTNGSPFTQAGSIIELLTTNQTSALSDNTHANLFTGAELQNGDTFSVRVYFAQFNEINYSVVENAASRYGNIVFYGSLVQAVDDRDNDGVDDDDDLFPDDPKRATIIDHINCIIEYVSDDAVIFDGDWKNKKMRKAYLNKLEVILELVTAAEAAEDPEAAALIYAEALDKVNNDLIKKTDGLQGVGASEKNDWLKVQAAQDIVYPDLLFLSEYLLEKTL